jgi:hypothetical protein
MKALTKGQREHVAAYLLDRADQYETDSPCWIGLVDAARNIASGEVERAAQCGEIDDDVLSRVRKMRKTAVAVDPSLGVDS